MSYAAFVGLDWADQQHAVCCQAAEGGVPLQSQVAQRAEELEAWASELRGRFGGRPIAVCLEQSRGAVIYALMKYEFFVLFPVNPKQFARFREAFSPGGAKNDLSDAELLCTFVQQHHQRLRAWKPDDETTRTLRLLVEDRRHWVDERTAAGNRLRQRLKECYPLALQLLGSGRMYAAWLLRLLAKFSSQRELQRAAPKTLLRYLPSRRRTMDDAEGADPRVAAIRAAQLPVTDAAVLGAGRLAVESLARLMLQLNQTIDDYDQQIAQCLAQHADAPLFKALPGAGATMAPRLIAAMGTDRERFASAADVQAFAGIAPVTVQSGKTRVVHKRQACSKFLRQTFHEFAGLSRLSSAWAAAYYRMMLARGVRHHAALRALAFKWIRVLFAVWKSRRPYDDARYLQTLQRKHSPLLAYLPPPCPS